MLFTDAKVCASKPNEKPYKVGDFEGLYVTVKPTGSRLWHMKYRVAGREKRLSFGTYPHILLAEVHMSRGAAPATGTIYPRVASDLSWPEFVIPRLGSEMRFQCGRPKSLHGRSHCLEVAEGMKH